MTIERAITLPEGTADVGVCLWAFPLWQGDAGGRRYPLSDWNQSDNCAATGIGKPLQRPPGASAALRD